MNNPTKSFLTVFLLFITVNTFGQSFNENQLVGKWNVVNLEGTLPVADSEKQNLEIFLNAFKEATFEFESNNNFTLHIDFKEVEDRMKQLHWKYDRNLSKIIVQDWKNKDNSEGILLELDVEKNRGNVFFKISKTPLIFEVEQEKGGGPKPKK